MSKKYAVIDFSGFAHIVELPPKRRSIERFLNEEFGVWVTYYEIWDYENPPEIRQRPYASD